MGVVRIKRELVPEAAFREALANAWSIETLMECPYSNRDVQTQDRNIFARRTPLGVTQDEYLNGTISVLKNPIIGNLFFRLGLIEALGTGIRRINEAYRGYDIKPNYQIFDNSITIELPTTTAAYEVTSDESEILNVLKGGAILSSSEIAARTSFSKSKVLRLIKDLTDKNYVSALGKGRSTKYKLR